MWKAFKTVFFFNKSVNYNTIYPKIDLIDYVV